MLYSLALVEADMRLFFLRQFCRERLLSHSIRRFVWINFPMLENSKNLLDFICSEKIILAGTIFQLR